MGGFDGPGFTMVDGSYVQTKVIDNKSSSSSTDISTYLSQIHNNSVQSARRMIGFQLEWLPVYSETEKKLKHHLSSVTLSTHDLCLSIKFTSQSLINNLKDLCGLFTTKHVTFIGVQIEEDLKMLEEIHGIVIRNAVDITSFAAKSYSTPLHATSGIRELARRILGCNLSRLDLIQSKWCEASSNERLEAEAIEGWLVYKLWEQLSW